MTKCAISFAVVLLAASSAFAQVDAYNLRAKYGQPLDREIFTVRPGIEMIVDYAAGKQACRIQLPSGKKIVGTVPVGAITKEQIHDILNEVVPPSIRGKELGRMMQATGAPMLFVTEYEHVTISELQINDVGQGITVTFKEPACAKQTEP
jgi:hypothetical protein